MRLPIYMPETNETVFSEIILWAELRYKTKNCIQDSGIMYTFVRQDLLSCMTRNKDMTLTFDNEKLERLLIAKFNEFLKKKNLVIPEDFQVLDENCVLVEKWSEATCSLDSQNPS